MKTHGGFKTKSSFWEGGQRIRAGWNIFSRVSPLFLKANLLFSLIRSFLYRFFCSFFANFFSWKKDSFYHSEKFWGIWKWNVVILFCDQDLNFVLTFFSSVYVYINITKICTNIKFFKNIWMCVISGKYRFFPLSCSYWFTVVYILLLSNVFICVVVGVVK